MTLATDARPPEESSEPPNRAPLGRSGTLAARLTVSLAIAAGFFWILRRGGLPMFPSGAAFAHMAWWAAPVYAPLYGLGALLRTYRWIHLLRPMEPRLSGRRVLGIGLVGFTAVLFAPLRMGEVVRPWLLSLDGRVSFMQAAGTVAAERIVDGLTLALILAAGLFVATPLSPLPASVGNLPLPVSAVPRAAFVALLMFAGAFLVMVAFYFWRVQARRVVHALVSVVSEPLAGWVTSKVEKLADGLQFLPSRRHTGAFMRDTLVYWAVISIASWLLLRGCGAAADFTEACVTMGIMGIGTLIPSGPGFFGTYQLSAYCGLAMFFPESVVLTSGAVFTFVGYTTQIVLTGVSGLIGVWLRARSPVLEPSTAESS